MALRADLAVFLRRNRAATPRSKVDSKTRKNAKASAASSIGEARKDARASAASSIGKERTAEATADGKAKATAEAASTGRDRQPNAAAPSCASCRSPTAAASKARLTAAALRAAGTHAMPIRPYLDGHRFDDETIRVMGIAFEMARRPSRCGSGRAQRGHGQQDH